MEAPNGRAEGVDAGTRILLLYVDTVQAADLVQRLASADYEVISCPLSAPTDRWLEELRPDLVLLTPSPEPRELLAACETVRARTERPLMVLSERSEELLVTRALATGIDEYLALPIGDRELAARIDAMLRRMHRNVGLEETRRVGDLVLSSVDHSAERSGRKAFLSPIEFRLLACLASAPGRVLTHQTLMSRVWGAEYVDSRHYLRVYIRYLREKIEDDPTNPQIIISEWGVGYRLQPPETSTSQQDVALPPSTSRQSRRAV